MLSLSFGYTQKENQSKVSFYDGTITGGYVNNGAFLNFMGPNIKMSTANSMIMLGMLPSLRFKEDIGIPKNALVTPSLGVGITFVYKAWAIQIPLYYNGKTSTENGKWKLGFGIGVRLNNFKQKQDKKIFNH